MCAEPSSTPKSDRGTLRLGRMILLMASWLQKICRALAWLLALAMVVLSLVPPSYRPITKASHNIEHLLRRDLHFVSSTRIGLFLSRLG
jgi:hypothetical protein